MPEEKFIAKIHRMNQEIILAVCDKDLLGERLFHNGVPITVSRYFYGEESYYPSELINLLKSATQINAIGVEIIQLMIEEEVINPDSVLWIDSDKSKVGHVISVGKT